MSERDEIRDAFAEALASGLRLEQEAAALGPGGPVLIAPVAPDVAAERDDRRRATCPDCAPRLEASARGYGEESFIRARCPEGVSFADWVRGLRGPDAAIRVTPGTPAIRSMGGDPA